MVGVVDKLDGVQRRVPPLGLPIAVIYKYFDDQGPYLAAIVTYYAFVAIFPLLLLATSILGFVMQGDPELYQKVLDSALAQFPVIGDQLGRPEGLQGSTGAVVAGILIAFYGSLGLGTAIQNAMNIAWSVPRNSRPNPFLLRLKSLLLLVITGAALFAVTTVSVLLRETENLVVVPNSGRLVAALGVRDLIIVDTPDAVLVCPRDRAQEVKSLVDDLRNKGELHYI